MTSITKETAHKNTIEAIDITSKITSIEDEIISSSRLGYDGFTLYVNNRIIGGQILFIEDIPKIEAYFMNKGFKVIVNKKRFSKKPISLNISW